MTTTRARTRTRAAAMAIGGIAVLAAVVTGTAPAYADAPSGGYELRYQDEFNGTAVNLDDWYYRETSAYAGAKGYMRAANVSEAGGSLHLKYSHEDVTSDGVPEYVGGGVISRQLLGYGYYEIRAKLLDSVDGLHNAFWSMGLKTGMTGANGDPRIEADIAASKLPENNQLYEIDGFEHNSDNPTDCATGPSDNKLDFGDITWAGGPDSRHGYRTECQYSANEFAGLDPVDFGDWNVYGYEYTPTQVKFFMNGVLMHTITINANRPYNPMNFWLTALPYAQSGSVYAPDPSLLPGTTDIDYFRYYAKPLPGVNLLGNGSFDVTNLETQPGNWIVPAWIEGYDKPASKLQTASTYNGTKALEHSGTSDYLVTTKQDLRYIPNGTYDLTAWVQSSGGQTQAALRVLNHGGPERVYDVPATSTWTQVTIPDVTVTNHRATIAITSNATAGQWLRVDGVSFDLD